MKKLSVVILSALIIFSAKGQSFLANGPENPSLEAGVGLIIQDPGVRFTLGSKDVFLNNRLGVYYSLEYRGAEESVADQTDDYLRNIMGLTFSVNKNWALRAGVGLFGKGSLLDSDNGLRKELTVTYQPNKIPLSIDVGYSFSVGPTTTLRYVLPLGGKEKISNDKPVEEIVEEPVEEAAEEAVEETVEEAVEETVEEAVEEIVEEPVEEIVEEPVEEVVEAPSAEILETASNISTYKYGLNEAVPGKLMTADLEKIAGYAKSNSSVKLTVIGHSCGKGSEEAKQSVSTNRAESVAKILEGYGVDSNQIEVIGNSDKEKIGSGRVNRRVEVKIK